MKNLEIGVRLADRSHQSFEFSSGKQLIDELISDDWGAPPTYLDIEATMEDGRKVRITIPYSKSTEVFVAVDDPK